MKNYKNILLSSAFAMLVPLSAGALPTGEDTVLGDATVSRATNGKDMTVNQTTDRAIIEWDNFRVESGEMIDFKQPGVNSIILNRVRNSSSYSYMDGKLNANGNVIIVDPNGIYNTGDVKANGYFLSQHDITNDNFMNGTDGDADRLFFNQTTARAQSDNVFIQNGHGIIEVTENLAFVSNSTHNTGLITSETGDISLAVGTDYILDLSGDNLVTFTDSSALGVSDNDPNPTWKYISVGGEVEAIQGNVSLLVADASKLDKNITHIFGDIKAENGTILIDAKGAYKATINNGTVARTTTLPYLKEVTGDYSIEVDADFKQRYDSYIRSEIENGNAKNGFLDLNNGTGIYQDEDGNLFAAAIDYAGNIYSSVNSVDTDENLGGALTDIAFSYAYGDLSDPIGAGASLPIDGSLADAIIGTGSNLPTDGFISDVNPAIPSISEHLQLVFSVDGLFDEGDIEDSLADEEQLIEDALVADGVDLTRDELVEPTDGFIESADQVRDIL